MPEHTKLFLTCDDWRFFFDHDKAQEEAERQKQEGKRVEIRGNQDEIMLFIFNQ